MFYLIIDVVKVIKQGIVLPDIASFLGSSSGQDFIKKEGILIYMEPDTYLWTPWGCLSIPLYFSMDMQPDRMSWQHVWALSHYASALVAEDKLDPAVTAAIIKYSKDHYLAGDTRMFQQRGQYLAAFEESLKA